MNISRLVFRISDVVNHPLRNYKRYPNVTVIKNIIYDTKYDDNINMLDIYFRSDVKEKYPVLFNIHGGGFVRGGKKYRSGFAKRFADKGWFVVNIGYRIAPVGRFPAATEDAINALNFVNGLAEQYNLDLSKIVITGDSAGGYYASHLISVICDEELRKSLNLPEYTGQKPRALLSFCAPFDLMKCFKRPTPFNVTVNITNCVFATEYQSSEEMENNFPYSDSQINIVSTVNKDWPEVFIVEAKNDSFCGNQARAMIEALNENGVENNVYIASHKGDAHCTHLLPFMPGNKQLYAEVDKFMKKIKSEKSSDDVYQNKSEIEEIKVDKK